MLLKNYIYLDMITKFKIFENTNIPKDENDLADLFSQKYIEEYFDNGYEIDANEVSQFVNIWKYIEDEDKVKAYFIEVELDSIEKSRKIGKEEFTEQDRKEKKEQLEDLWEDTDISDIMEQLWGKHARYEPYNYVSQFVDKNEMVGDHLDNIDFDTKYEYLRDYIHNDYGLQKKLLEINPNTVEALFDVMDSTVSIGTTYEFQKLYIKTNVEREDPKDEDEITAHVIKQINDKFVLDPKIEKEYKDQMYMIDSEKYNL